jgi:hypothetical protein
MALPADLRPSRLVWRHGRFAAPPSPALPTPCVRVTDGDLLTTPAPRERACQSGPRRSWGSATPACSSVCARACWPTGPPGQGGTARRRKQSAMLRISAHGYPWYGYRPDDDRSRRHDDRARSAGSGRAARTASSWLSTITTPQLCLAAPNPSTPRRHTRSRPPTWHLLIAAPSAAAQINLICARLNGGTNDWQIVHIGGDARVLSPWAGYAPWLLGRLTGYLIWVRRHDAGAQGVAEPGFGFGVVSWAWGCTS